MGKIKSVLLLIFIAISLTACGTYTSIDISKDNAKVTYYYYLTAKEEKSIVTSVNKSQKTSFSSFEEIAKKLGLSKAKSKVINKTANNGYKISTSYSKEEYDNIFLHFDKNYATISADNFSNQLKENYKSIIDTDKLVSKYDVIKVKYPYKVVKSNGKIQSDGYTVIYNRKNLSKADKRYYAIFNKKLNTAVAIKDVKHKTIYINKNTKISLNTISTSFSVNSKELYKDSYSLTKDGKYAFLYTNINGKTKKNIIVLDKTKPTTNIKAKSYKKKVKITYKDALSGIKIATLNNKPIKSDTIISKKGSYTLIIIDKAGNKQNIKFKIV